jgi:urea transport system permease protein
MASHTSPAPQPFHASHGTLPFCPATLGADLHRPSGGVHHRDHHSFGRFRAGIVSTSFVKILGKTLCLCLIAIAMDLVWGYCGILSLGHFAFFGLGGYMIGMWLMYERTKDIVICIAVRRRAAGNAERRSSTRSARRSSVWSAASEIPVVWYFADSLIAQLALVVLVPGLLALVFGWLAFRSRVTGVYLSILTQAMTLALSLYLFPERFRPARQQRPFGPAEHSRPDRSAAIGGVGVVLPGLGAGAGAGLCASPPGWSRASSAIVITRHPRRRGAHPVHGLSGRGLQAGGFHAHRGDRGIAGALYYPQAGIINPAEIAPIASIYLAVWVAIGGRGRLYGAVIGAALVSLLSSWFTGGQAPSIPLGFYTIDWVDWWQVLLGPRLRAGDAFIAPNGIGGLFDRLIRKEAA